MLQCKAMVYNEQRPQLQNTTHSLTHLLTYKRLPRAVTTSSYQKKEAINKLPQEEVQQTKVRRQFVDLKFFGNTITLRNENRKRSVVIRMLTHTQDQADRPGLS